MTPPVAWTHGEEELECFRSTHKLKFFNDSGKKITSFLDLEV